MDKTLKISPKQLAIGAAILVLVLLVGMWRMNVNEQKRRDEEIATAEGLARVVGATFTGSSDLKVAVLEGTIDVTSIDRGPIFDSKLKGRIPASVDYFVNLSNQSLSRVRYDAKTRTLFVEVPDVRIAKPNLSLAEARFGEAEGPWVSRRASAALMNRAVKLANERAKTEASKPELVEKARAEGRTSISQIMQKPLEIAGMADIRIVVRYPSDAGKIDERWDVSRSIQEVLNEAQQRRAEGVK